MRIMLFWSAAIGWRRFYQGMLVGHGHTRLVTYGTGFRLVATVGVAVWLARMGTIPGAQVGAAYLEISNSGKAADRVVGVSTPAAERVELHVQMREGDILKMREVQGFEVPARQRLTLRPGGSHLMLVGLRKPLVAGERIPLTLRFERAGELKIEVEVQAGESKKAHH